MELKKKYKTRLVPCDGCGKSFYMKWFNKFGKYWCSKKCKPVIDIEYKRNRDRIAKKKYYNTEKGGQIIRNLNKISREKNIEKVKARYIVRYHLKVGNIKKPTRCSECHKKPLKMEAHHEDYSKPLQVVWLCTPCHNKRHKVI
jgi:hypothetical protein